MTHRPEPRDPGPIVPARHGPAPVLSFAQQRMWFAEQLAPDRPVYNVPVSVRLSGPLDQEALRRAVTWVMRRHEVLRTVYPPDGDRPVPRVREMTRADLPLVDLSALPGEAAREEALRALVDSESERVFDLARDVPARWLLVRLGEEEHALVATLHHIAADGWSIGLLLSELAAYYATPVSALREPPALPLQYTDYAAWQHARWEAGAFDGQLDYWRARLADLTPLDLPADRPRGAAGPPRGGRFTIVLDAPLATALRKLAAERDVTLFTVALAAFHLTLGKLAGQDDVVVGTPVAGRTRIELEELVGCFVNTLAVRADLSGDPSFAELLGAVRAEVLGALGHQEVPFERVVEAVAGERDLTRTPVFQAMFTFQDAVVPTLDLGGLRIAPLATDRGVAPLTDVVCTLTEDGDRLSACFEFDADLFDESTVAGFARCYRRVLEQVSADPLRPLSGVDLLDDAERLRVLTEWNDTGRPLPSAAVHEQIAGRARHTPAPVAVEDGTRRLDYGELDEQAEELALRLASEGVGPESVVALVTEPTAELVVAMLAVLKAGGAFLPLDPGYPPARLRSVLGHARPHLVLADAASARVLDGVVAGDALRVLGAWPDGRPAPPRALPETAHAQSLACVFYTSGSTGIPKGVAVTHGALANYTRAMVERLQLTRDDRFLQLASIGFDVLLEEVFPALAAGATVVMPGHPLLAAGTDLTAYVEAHGITCLELTTAYWHTWVDDLTARRRSLPASLRLVAMGGERVLADRLAAWRALGVPLLHVYGLTEVTCTSTVHLVPGREPGDTGDGGSGLPIGRPLDNTRVYLLDRHLRPVPAGVPGELYLGGAGLARGYLHQPARTADRFLPDPFDPAPGARMYRTGDLARHRSDGSLDFLGRVDNQVKLRGFRIELGEVEAALAEHPGVSAAVAVVREDRPGDRRLVGYAARATPPGSDPAGPADVAAPADVVAPAAPAPARAASTAPAAPADPDAPPDPEALRSFVRDRLPAYMVPSAVVVLDALPLTANGKVDRAALPAPGRDAPASPAQPPRTPMEDRLAALCAELLDRDGIGVDDDFFALGGHSLLATQLVTRVRTEFAVDVSLRAFFEAPTVARLAEQILTLQAAALDEAELDSLLAELTDE
ncbi:amino acid adenylation domain-containing protein [Streptomyces sp. Go40/10]|uniref:non-ribosomal peptide synthetase n=1 Tax=Streptomyces sp. Go40/10 TaxID=2825844 RepID=UPI001E43687B|nr:non-ribosomal peptide synthetase [Streptomyces sp. Go40/10]UFR00358.1 amino acid adenylation domain-containing protein [Streptomyces sp. Go40/10]